MSFTISQSTYERVLANLGYSQIGDAPVLPTFSSLEQAQFTETMLNETCDKLELILEQIDELMPDSLAVKVDTLEVNYKQQYMMLLHHGKRYTKRLEAFAHLPSRQSYFSTDSLVSNFVG